MKRFLALGVAALLVAAISVADVNAQCCGQTYGQTYAPMTWSNQNYNPRCGSGYAYTGHMATGYNGYAQSGYYHAPVSQGCGGCGTTGYTAAPVSSCCGQTACAPARRYTSMRVNRRGYCGGYSQAVNTCGGGCGTCQTAASSCCGYATNNCAQPRMLNRRWNYSTPAYSSGCCSGCAGGQVIMDGTTQGTIMEGGVVEPGVEPAPSASDAAGDATPPTPDDT